MSRDDTVLVIGDGDFEDILCQVDGNDLRLHGGLLLFWDIQWFEPECWHIAMPRKSGRSPSHHCS